MHAPTLSELDSSGNEFRSTLSNLDKVAKFRFSGFKSLI